MALQGFYFGQPAEWLQSELTTWRAAHTAVASGQAYSIGAGASSRQLTRANLPEIQSTLKELQAALDQQQQLDSGSQRPRVSYAQHLPSAL